MGEKIYSYFIFSTYNYKEEIQMAYIYKITNDINNKVYIGLTTLNNPIDRWTKHLGEYTSATKYSKRPLYEAMNKYGIEHFHFEIVEETNEPKEREKYWINYYKSYIGFKDCNGYNATLGGNGVAKLVFTDEEQLLITKLYREGKSCTEIAKLTHHKIETITKFFKQNQWNIKNYKGNKIGQYDLCDNFIQEFPSANQASIYLGKKDHGSHIIETCQGKRKTAYGYKWKYL